MVWINVDRPAKQKFVLTGPPILQRDLPLKSFLLVTFIGINDAKHANNCTMSITFIVLMCSKTK